MAPSAHSWNVRPWRASRNHIRDAGAADIAKALASGQCGLTALYLGGESAAPRARWRCRGGAVGWLRPGAWARQ
eukprot:COSAG01_NODE_3639_length_5840_cov_3.816060_8_plen_73_part_01